MDKITIYDKNNNKYTLNNFLVLAKTGERIGIEKIAELDKNISVLISKETDEVFSFGNLFPRKKIAIKQNANNADANEQAEQTKESVDNKEISEPTDNIEKCIDLDSLALTKSTGEDMCVSERVVGQENNIANIIDLTQPTTEQDNIARQQQLDDWEKSMANDESAEINEYENEQEEDEETFKEMQKQQKLERLNNIELPQEKRNRLEREKTKIAQEQECLEQQQAKTMQAIDLFPDEYDGI